jgi:hypothetical protein
MHRLMRIKNANLRRFTAILSATTYYTKRENSCEFSSFRSGAAGDSLLCDMASCHRDKMSNKKFCLDIYTLSDESTTGCLEKSWYENTVKQHPVAEEWNLQRQKTSLWNRATLRYLFFRKHEDKFVTLSFPKRNKRRDYCVIIWGACAREFLCFVCLFVSFCFSFRNSWTFS